MNKHLYLFVLLLITNLAFAQSKIDWDSDYRLQFSDFVLPGVEIGNGDIYRIYSGATFGFGFRMSSYEYMFTRNFNDKVECHFNTQSAALTAPDSVFAYNLLAYAQFSFDLSELYTRKFRKEIYENKSTFSSYEIFLEAFNKWNNEYSKRYATVGQETDLGQKKEQLELLHHQVLKEIEELSEFCKTCKPKKKKRSRK